MELNLITEEGLWKDFANYINYNFNKLNIAITREKEIGSAKLSSFKGVFVNTTSSLISNYPNPQYGDYAFVIKADSTFSVYIADINGNWILLSNNSYKPEVDLSKYVEIIALSEIEDIDDDINDYLNIINSEN